MNPMRETGQYRNTAGPRMKLSGTKPQKRPSCDRPVVSEAEVMPIRHLDRSHVVAVRVFDIGLEDFRAVDEDRAVAHLDRVSRQAYHALHKVAPRVDRIFEYGDVPAFRAVVREMVPEFENEHPVAYLKRRYHRTARYPESLHYKGTEYQREDDRPEHRLYRLAPPRFRHCIYLHKSFASGNDFSL